MSRVEKIEKKWFTAFRGKLYCSASEQSSADWDNIPDGWDEVAAISKDGLDLIAEVFPEIADQFKIDTNALSQQPPPEHVRSLGPWPAGPVTTGHKPYLLIVEKA